jgi:hypothetical protein
MNKAQYCVNVDNSAQARIQPDVLLALESRIADIAKTMCENKTILAYEKIRQLGEFIAYERAKHSAQ